MNNEQHDTSDEAILTYVKKNLGVVIGDPELAFTEINMDTKFGSDLELESIEFVVLADRMRTEFGNRVNFVDFLSKKSVDEVVSLSVGDVVRYVGICLREDESLQEGTGQ